MLSLILLALTASSPLPEAATTHLGDHVVRVRDVAVTPTGGDLPLLELPAAGVTLSPEDMGQLVVNRLPGIRFALRRGHAVHFVGARETASGWAGNCLRARIDIAAGAQISNDLVEVVPCGWVPAAAMSYDRGTRTVVARTDITAGTALGHVRVFERTTIASGQGVLLRTAIGAVVIERQVTALQSARAGKRLFARTSDGVTLSSRVESHDEDDR